uniref:Uncharacterized protein n=1 Tax=Musca domestica TaxID=7370 RepID=A0A1I8MKF3_MUSDO
MWKFQIIFLLIILSFLNSIESKSDEVNDELPKESQNVTDSVRLARGLKYPPRNVHGPIFSWRRRQPIQIRSRADHFPLRPQLRRVHNGVLPANQQRFGFENLKSSKYVNGKGALPFGAGLKGSSSLKQQLLGVHPNGLHVPALSQQYVQNFKASPAFNGQAVVIHPPPPAATGPGQPGGNKLQKQQQQQQQLQHQQPLKSTSHDPAMPYPDFKQYPIPDQQQMQKYNEQHDKYLQQQKYLTPRDPVAYYQQQYHQQQPQQQPQHLYQQQQPQQPQSQPPTYSVQQPAFSAAHNKPVQLAAGLSAQPSIPIHELGSSNTQTGHSPTAATISATNQQQQQQPQQHSTSYGHGHAGGPVKMYSVYEENDMTELHNNDYQTAQYESLEKEAQEYLRFMNTNDYFLPKRDPNYRQIDEENDRRQQQYSLQKQQQQQQSYSPIAAGSSQYPQQTYHPQQQYSAPKTEPSQQIYYGQHHPDSSVAASHASSASSSSSQFKEPIQVSKLFYQDETPSNGGAAGASTVVRTSYQTAYNANHFGNADKGIGKNSATSSSPVSVNNVYSQVRQSAPISGNSNRTPEPIRFEFTERDAMVGGIAYTHAPQTHYKYKAVDTPVTPRISGVGNPQATTTTALPSTLRSSAYLGEIKPIVEVEDDPEDEDDIMQQAGSNLYGRQPLPNKNGNKAPDTKGNSSGSSTTTEAPPSEQKDNEDYCERICAIVEDENEEIVCGSDGYMYTSEAQMECYASCLRIDITIQGKGSCSAR